MSFRKDSKDYEAWLAKQCDVVKKDIAYKHLRMKKSAFIFLRATYSVGHAKSATGARS